MTQSTSTSALFLAVLAVPEAERVCELVDECADLAVGVSGGDDDLPVLGVAPAARPLVGQLTDLDAVAEVVAEVPQWCDQVSVAVAVDQLCRGSERDGLDAGQRIGHADVEDWDGAKEDALLARLHPSAVALLDGDSYCTVNRQLARSSALIRRARGAGS